MRAGAREPSLSYDVAVLGTSRYMGFIPVADVGVARQFYESQLGLAVLDESPFALVVDADGTKLRITPVGEFAPFPFTIAGWDVADIDATVATLVERGVVFTRYEGMEQRANGVWEAPSGDLVAWFTDPDGNTLSLTEFSQAS
jgi:catechol 2,3-dioxygenase-like lactoylglutathione lyase family enzyme